VSYQSETEQRKLFRRRDSTIPKRYFMKVEPPRKWDAKNDVKRSENLLKVFDSKQDSLNCWELSPT